MELPDLIEKKRKKNEATIRKIMERGAIKGESEFYLIRQAIDELEKDADDEKLHLFYRLVDQYESWISRVDKFTKPNFTKPVLEFSWRQADL